MGQLFLSFMGSWIVWHPPTGPIAKLLNYSYVFNVKLGIFMPSGWPPHSGTLHITHFYFSIPPRDIRQPYCWIEYDCHINHCSGTYLPYSCTCLHCLRANSTKSIHCCFVIAGSWSSWSTGIKKECIASLGTTCGPRACNSQMSFLWYSLQCVAVWLGRM